MRHQYLIILILIGITLIELHGVHKHNHGAHKHNHERPKTVSKQHPLITQLSSILSKVPGNTNLLLMAEASIEKFSKFTLFTKIFLSISIISIIPFILLVFIPINIHHDQSKNFFLHIMLSFAAGCLLGDAFLHIIPHSMMANPDHSTELGLLILLGIFIFFIIEKFINFLRECSHGSDIHQNDKEKFFLGSSIRIKWLLDIVQLSVIRDLNVNKDTATKLYSPSKLPEKLAVDKMNHQHSHNHKIATSGVLNLFADTVHNFMDGLAIGSAYMIGDKAGLLTTMSIFWHEIPHELSDFAILLKSGFSKYRAMLLQLVTAIGAFTGGLVVYYTKGTEETAFSMIPPLAAGGFIYMSCVTIIPEMLERKGVGFIRSAMEVIAFILGIAIFQIMIMYE